METMRQCQLKQSTGAMLISWIDAKLAVKGKRFTLKLDDEKQTPIFEVMQAWETERSVAEVRERGHDYTRTRKNSDI